MVQQRAVAVLRRLELQQEVGEELHVIGVDLRQLLDLLGHVLVMAERVVRLRNADLRIGRTALLAPDHERDHARHVGLVGQQHQVEHQRGVLFIRDRDPRRSRNRGQLAVGLLLDDLDAPLDLAGGFQVLVDLAPVVGRQSRLQTGDLVHDDIEHAALLLRASAAHLGARIADVAEQAFEYRAGIRFPRHRGRRIRPRVVQVRATEAAVAGGHAIDGVPALERELQRGQRRLVPQSRRIGGDLVHRNAQLQRRPGRALRLGAGQEGGGRRRVAGALAGPRGADAVQSREHHDLVADRLERLQGRRQLEAGACRLRGPVLARRAVRHDHDAKTLGRHRRGLAGRGQGRHHGIQEGQRERRPHPAQHGAPRDRLLGNEHQPALLV